MIYIVSHKIFKEPELENYVSLQVGARGKASICSFRDDEADNISDKNPHFCELTGLYWIWKNVTDEYKGLVHYRRYFGKSNWSSSLKHIYTYKELVNMLEDADIILPYIESLKQDAKTEILRECCTPEIFSELEDVIKELYPDYIVDFDKFFSQNKVSLFNMMFCRAEYFDEYCKWLFDILFELEKRVDLSKLNAYQQRLYGFLSERLLNVWVIHEGLKVKHVPVIQTEMKFRQKLTLFRRRITNQIYFKMANKGEK